MTEQPTNPEHEDDLSTVMKALLTTFENLGAEHRRPLGKSTGGRAAGHVRRVPDDRCTACRRALPPRAFGRADDEGFAAAHLALWASGSGDTATPCLGVMGR